MNSTCSSRILASIFMLATLLAAGPASADVPNFVTYSGRLTDGTAWGQTSAADLTFWLCEEEQGDIAECVWTEALVDVQLEDGYFAVTLGQTLPLPVPLPPAAWLAVAVDSGQRQCRHRHRSSKQSATRSRAHPHRNRRNRRRGWPIRRLQSPGRRRRWRRPHEAVVRRAPGRPGLGQRYIDVKAGAIEHKMSRLALLPNGGNVGILTTEPEAKLQINSGSDTEPALLVKQFGNAPTLFKVCRGESQCDETSFVIQQDGSVGIGTPAPSGGGTKLHVMGNVQATDYLYNSTRALKDGVVALTEREHGEALAQLKELALVRFRFKAEGPAARRHLGLIAEDSPAQILSKDGKAVSISDYVSFVAAAVKAVAADNDRLRNENNELRSRLDSVEQRLLALEED